jgi:hypothetical protein
MCKAQNAYNTEQLFYKAESVVKEASDCFTLCREMYYFKCKLNMVRLEPTTEVLFKHTNESSWSEYVEILNTIFTYVTCLFA